MLRVTPTDTKEGTTLILEGKLSGPWVDEVQECWTGYATPGHQAKIRVNLREVSYVDGRGRDLLIRMEREGASLIEASDFITHLLSESVLGEGQSATISGKS